MNKIHILIFVLATSAIPNTIKAQKSIGGRLGISDPQSFLTVTYKNEYKGAALEFNGGLTLGNPTWFTGHIDYYFFERDLDFNIDGLVQWYVGAGGQVWFRDSFVIGPDGKIGLEYKFENAPLEAFIDLAAFLGFNADVNANLGMQLGIGLRKTF